MLLGGIRGRIIDIKTNMFESNGYLHGFSLTGNEVYISSSQQRTKSDSAGEEKMPPREPAPDECCGNGCMDCVWTQYWAELKQYKIKKGEIDVSLPPVPDEDPFVAFERKLLAQKKGK